MILSKFILYTLTKKMTYRMTKKTKPVASDRSTYRHESNKANRDYYSNRSVVSRDVVYEKRLPRGEINENESISSGSISGNSSSGRNGKSSVGRSVMTTTNGSTSKFSAPSNSPSISNKVANNTISGEICKSERISSGVLSSSDGVEGAADEDSQMFLSNSTMKSLKYIPPLQSQESLHYPSSISASDHTARTVGTHSGRRGESESPGSKIDVQRQTDVDKEKEISSQTQISTANSLMDLTKGDSSRDKTPPGSIAPQSAQKRSRLDQDWDTNSNSMKTRCLQVESRNPFPTDMISQVVSVVENSSKYSSRDSKNGEQLEAESQKSRTSRHDLSTVQSTSTNVHGRLSPSLPMYSTLIKIKILPEKSQSSLSRSTSSSPTLLTNQGDRSGGDESSTKPYTHTSTTSVYLVPTDSVDSAGVRSQVVGNTSINASRSPRQSSHVQPINPSPLSTEAKLSHISSAGIKNDALKSSQLHNSPLNPSASFNPFNKAYISPRISTSSGIISNSPRNSQTCSVLARQVLERQTRNSQMDQQSPQNLLNMTNSPSPRGSTNNLLSLGNRAASNDVVDQSRPDPGSKQSQRLGDTVPSIGEHQLNSSFSGSIALSPTNQKLNVPQLSGIDSALLREYSPIVSQLSTFSMDDFDPSRSVQSLLMDGLGSLSSFHLLGPDFGTSNSVNQGGMKKDESNNKTIEINGYRTKDSEALPNGTVQSTPNSTPAGPGALQASQSVQPSIRPPVILPSLSVPGSRISPRAHTAPPSPAGYEQGSIEERLQCLVSANRPLDELLKFIDSAVDSVNQLLDLEGFIHSGRCPDSHFLPLLKHIFNKRKTLSTLVGSQTSPPEKKTSSYPTLASTDSPANALTRSSLSESILSSGLANPSISGLPASGSLSSPPIGLSGSGMVSNYLSATRLSQVLAGSYPQSLESDISTMEPDFGHLNGNYLRGLGQSQSGSVGMNLNLSVGLGMNLSVGGRSNSILQNGVQLRLSSGLPNSSQRMQGTGEQDLIGISTHSTENQDFQIHPYGNALQLGGMDLGLNMGRTYSSSPINTTPPSALLFPSLEEHIRQSGRAGPPQPPSRQARFPDSAGPGPGASPSFQNLHRGTAAATAPPPPGIPVNENESLSFGLGHGMGGYGSFDHADGGRARARGRTRGKRGRKALFSVRSHRTAARARAAAAAKAAAAAALANSISTYAGSSLSRNGLDQQSHSLNMAGNAAFQYNQPYLNQGHNQNQHHYEGAFMKNMTTTPLDLGFGMYNDLSTSSDNATSAGANNMGFNRNTPSGGFNIMGMPQWGSVSREPTKLNSGMLHSSAGGSPFNSKGAGSGTSTYLNWNISVSNGPNFPSGAKNEQDASHDPVPKSNQEGMALSSNRVKGDVLPALSGAPSGSVPHDPSPVTPPLANSAVTSPLVLSTQGTSSMTISSGPRESDVRQFSDGRSAGPGTLNLTDDFYGEDAQDKMRTVHQQVLQMRQGRDPASASSVSLGADESAATHLLPGGLTQGQFQLLLQRQQAPQQPQLLSQLVNSSQQRSAIDLHEINYPVPRGVRVLSRIGAYTVALPDLRQLQSHLSVQNNGPLGGMGIGSGGELSSSFNESGNENGWISEQQLQLQAASNYGIGTRTRRISMWLERRLTRNWSKEAMVRYPHRAEVVARRMREQGRFS